MRVETYPNGEGKVLHLWHDEISGLNEKEIEEVAKEFIEVSNKYSWQHCTMEDFWKCFEHIAIFCTGHLLYSL